MKHYKDAQNNLFGFEDDILVPADYVEISMEEVAAINNAKATAVKPTKDQVRRNRAAAYAAESDPIFFKAQRGEATMDDWRTAVAAIQLSFPYPDEEVTP